MSYRTVILTQVPGPSCPGPITPVFRGMMVEKPRCGEPFFMALTEGPRRLGLSNGLHTTGKVLNVVQDEQNNFVFETRNAKYHLELLPPVQ